MLTFNLLIVFAAEIIPPDSRDFHQRLDRRGYRVQLRAFDVVPTHRSLQQTPALLLGDEEYFRIETEPVNPLQSENRLRRLSSKGLEAALRVFESQSGECELDQITDAPYGLTEKRLMRSDQTAIERPRPENDIVTTFGYRLDHFGYFGCRRRQISVEKKNDLAVRFKHSVSHGIAFPPIPGVLDQAKPASPSPFEFERLRGSMVCRTVIDYNYFARIILSAQIVESFFESPPDAIFFVIRRYNN